MRSPIEFEKQAIDKGITKWLIHDCSMCGYPCGYYFEQNGEVYYDNGCDCTRRYVYRKVSWEDVANHYNIQDHPDCIKRYDNFWGFETIKESV
jgi:hypothetical protein